MTTQPGTKKRIGQTRTTAVSGTSQAISEAARIAAAAATRAARARRRRRRSVAPAGARGGLVGRGFHSGSMIASMPARTILHVDLDAFFAAVEQRDRPELRGRPVVVGGAGGEDSRGVVSAASYEARVFGIHSAMSLREAYRRCPDAVFLPVDGRRYQAASRDVMAILRRYTPLVEPISIDEAFLDVTGSAALFGDGPSIARRIKDETRAEVGLTASVGVASTKLVAKIASDLRKPDGLVVVPVGEEEAFLAPLPIARLWGVGEKTAVALRDYNVRTIGDLAALPPDLLDPAVREARGVARGSGARGRCRYGPRRRSGQVGRPRAHVRCRHQRPGGHRADAARDGRRRRRAGCVRRASGPGPSRSRSATAASGRSPASGRCRSRPT